MSEYQAFVEGMHNKSLPVRDQLANYAIGLAGENGEVCEVVKKHLYHGNTLDLEKLSKELGDVLFYVTALSAASGIDLEVVAAINIAKLRARHPNGFSVESAIAAEKLK